MRYMGGKHRMGRMIARELVKLLPGKTAYVEPFCGSCNVIRHIRHPQRIAADSHEDLIEMWLAIQNGWDPPDFVDKETYQEQRKAPSPSALKGYCGFGASFGGKWMACWTGDNDANLTREKSKDLTDVTFVLSDYRSLEIPDGSLVYCDPPYRGMTKYRGAGHFDSDEFWEWAKEKSQQNTVIVSEYEAPEGWRSFFKKTRTNVINNMISRPLVHEHLFILETP